MIGHDDKTVNICCNCNKYFLDIFVLRGLCLMVFFFFFLSFVFFSVVFKPILIGRDFPDEF